MPQRPCDYITGDVINHSLLFDLPPDASGVVIFTISNNGSDTLGNSAVKVGIDTTLAIIGATGPAGTVLASASKLIMKNLEKSFAGCNGIVATTPIYLTPSMLAGLPFSRVTSSIRGPNGWLCQTSNYTVAWSLEKVQTNSNLSTAASATSARWTKLDAWNNMLPDASGYAVSSLLPYKNLIYIYKPDDTVFSWTPSGPAGNSGVFQALQPAQYRYPDFFYSKTPPRIVFDGAFVFQGISNNENRNCSIYSLAIGSQTSRILVPSKKLPTIMAQSQTGGNIFVQIGPTSVLSADFYYLNGTVAKLAYIIDFQAQTAKAASRFPKLSDYAKALYLSDIYYVYNSTANRWTASRKIVPMTMLNSGAITYAGKGVFYLLDNLPYSMTRLTLSKTDILSYSTQNLTISGSDDPETPINHQLLDAYTWDSVNQRIYIGGMLNKRNLEGASISDALQKYLWAIDLRSSSVISTQTAAPQIQFCGSDNSGALCDITVSNSTKYPTSSSSTRTTTTTKTTTTSRSTTRSTVTLTTTTAKPTTTTPKSSQTSTTTNA
ncbi:hypothetical protein OIO90_001040 [Microbotryomycetes sp. JL221]|nr:hypothetical protein OIO90_001040 [Microbotryomycetes sp. JL221]